MASEAAPLIRRANLADMVFERLKERILSGDYKPGELLPTQEELSKQFGVSRTVMRDAFHKLSSLGMVDIHQGKGSFIRSSSPGSVMSSILSSFNMDASSVQDLMEARYYLEASIVRLAAYRVEPADLEFLADNLSRMEKAVADGDLQGFASIDFEFHQKLAEISRNEVLIRLVDLIREMMRTFFLSFAKTPNVAPRAVQYHKDIYRALAAKDPDDAEKKLRAHLEDIIANLKRNYDIEILI